MDEQDTQVRKIYRVREIQKSGNKRKRIFFYVCCNKLIQDCVLYFRMFDHHC